MSAGATGIFISYKREERAYAQALRDRLVILGYDVWWDAEIQTGSRWHDALDKALSESACVIVLWSERSIQSPWVQYEASVAAAQGRLAQVVIESGFDVAPQFSREQHADLVGWDGSVGHVGVQSLIARFDALGVRPTRVPKSFQPWDRAWPTRIPGHRRRRWRQRAPLLIAVGLGLASGIALDRGMFRASDANVASSQASKVVDVDRSEAHLREEVMFRLQQMDAAIDKARTDGLALIEDLQVGPVRGERIRDYFHEIGVIGATIELGGLDDVPGSDDRSFSFGYGGYGVRNLPQQRGYKRTEFQESTVLELVTACGANPETRAALDGALQKLDRAVTAIPQDIGKRVAMAQLHVQDTVPGYLTEIRAGLEWIEGVRNAWAPVSSSKARICAPAGA